jgi:acetate kinase
VRILTVNPGSSSFKAHLVDGDDVVAAADCEPDGADLAKFVAGHPAPAAIACRIVHGGPDLVEPVIFDPSVRALLEQVVGLAPLHNPAALRALDVLAGVLPGVPVVACFDTAFHRTIPDAARRWALPAAWAELGIRRYGFHGFAHRWASRRAALLLDRPLAELRLVTCHLGAGASLCAIAAGASVDTTMGFTPADGLVMASRAGAIDPGAVAYAVDLLGLSGAEAARALEHDGGLLAMTGSSDMRWVEAEAVRGSTLASEALAVYDHQFCRHLGAMVAVLGGIDGIVFSGGVGEGSPRTRAAACVGLAFIGLRLDAAANAALGPGGPDRVISEPDSAVVAAVVHAREELELAAAARQVLAIADPG